LKHRTVIAQNHKWEQITNLRCRETKGDDFTKLFLPGEKLLAHSVLRKKNCCSISPKIKDPNFKLKLVHFFANFVCHLPNTVCQKKFIILCAHKWRTRICWWNRPKVKQKVRSKLNIGDVHDLFQTKIDIRNEIKEKKR